MFNRRFQGQVYTQLLRILGQQARDATAAPITDSPALRYNDDDVVAFVDMQNFHYFLKENCRVEATQVHMPNLLNEFASMHNIKLTEMIFFTGIHDYARDPQKHMAMTSRLRWLEKCGVRVVALPVAYRTDRRTLQVRVEEKGIDVRIGCELLKAVTLGLRRALMVTQDIDLTQAIEMATEMALERGSRFFGYSPSLAGEEWDDNGRCGVNGLRGTTRLAMTPELARKHVRPERFPGERDARARERAQSTVQP